MMKRPQPWFRDVMDAADKMAPVTLCLRRLAAAGIQTEGSSSYGTGTARAFGNDIQKARQIVNSSGCRIRTEKVTNASPGGQVGGKGPNWAPVHASVWFEFEPI